MLCHPTGGAEGQCASFKLVAQDFWNTDCSRDGRKKCQNFVVVAPGNLPVLYLPETMQSILLVS